MIIFGIDPGIATIGFGILQFDNRNFNLINCGIISTPPNTPLSDRLLQISEDLHILLSEYSPDAVSIEELFFNTNITTGISVAHGRGVILLECRKFGCDIFEYTPLQVKQSVTGYGRAEKKQVMEMVKKICRLNSIPKPDDAADAVALAICHARCSSSLLFDGGKNSCSTI